MKQTAFQQATLIFGSLVAFHELVSHGKLHFASETQWTVFWAQNDFWKVRVSVRQTINACGIYNNDGCHDETVLHHKTEYKDYVCLTRKSAETKGFRLKRTTVFRAEKMLDAPSKAGVIVTVTCAYNVVMTMLKPNLQRKV